MLFISRTTTSAFRSASRSAPKSASGPRTSHFSSSAKANPSPLRSFGLSRTPSELGGVQSLLPLHSAVSLARMTSHLSTSSRSCRSLLQELGQSVPRD
ncbi:LOW QUALITY PROTEIN: hypothetical protein V2J09_018581 [Rumex salicifolius]